MRVLLVSAERAVVPPWADRPDAHIELQHARSLAAAADMLRTDHVDAVVFESDFISRVGRDRHVRRGFTELREQAIGTPFIVMSDGHAAPPMPALDSFIDMSVPPRTAPDVQAQLVMLAAEKAALNATLEQRTQELADSRARFRGIIERNADAILVVGRDGVVRFANPAAIELLDGAHNELVGTQFGFPCVAGETTELDLLSGREPRVVEMRVVESEWEGDAACIASLRDITERKRAEEAARGLIREQVARSQAELSARRFRLLADASTVLASSLDYAATLTALARVCVGTIADWAVIYIADDAGGVQRLEVAHHDPALSEAARDLQNAAIAPNGKHPALSAIANRTPVLARTVDDALLADITDDDTHRELVRRLGISSFMIVPLVARERCLGAIALVSAQPQRSYDEQDLALALDIAWRAALAVDNARLYREAHEANTAKTDLLAVISHDLRTPLNAIIGHADLLAMGLPERLGPASLQRVNRIQTSTRHLLYLIEELLSFARLEAGRAEVRWQDVDARMLAHEVAAVIDQLAQERNLRFVLQTGDEPVPLRTDPDKLRQVLLNLAGNAVNYTSAGEVCLRTSANRDGGVTFEVCDTGSGIRESDIPHIFEPFWRGDGARRAHGSGSGLGLSVVHRLVILLGGEVNVRSTLGAGSTFRVSLPGCPGRRSRPPPRRSVPTPPT